jgi:hypothetical protein
MKTVNLDGVVMRVRSTSENGVVDANTRLYFTQKGASVFARYSGGSVKRGCLAGTISGAKLIVRYAQLEESGKIHGGRSICEVQLLPHAGLRVIEHFTWHTRSGCGTNIFDEIRP